MIRKYIIIYILVNFLILCTFSLSISKENEKYISILIDISLSISKNDFKLIKEATISYINELKGNEKIAIYTIGNEPLKAIDFTDNKEFLIQEINKLYPSAIYTTIYDTIFFASKDLALYKNELKAIIMLSDGLNENSTLLFDDIARMLTEEKISIYAIRVGKNINGERTLKRLSLLSNGKYYDLSDMGARAITNSINKELDIISERIIKEKKSTLREESISKVDESLSKEVIQKPIQVPEKKIKEEGAFSILNILILVIILIILVIGIFGLVIYVKGKKEKRKCPKCGRVLEEYQLQCPDCQVEEKVEKEEAEEEKIIIAPELLKKTPVPEEAIENTFVLLEKPLLIIRKGKMIGKKFYLSYDRSITIGRSENCDISLEDITISSQHCRIIPQQDKFIIVDLQSTNGTFINEKKIKQSILKEGDIIRVGETQLLYKIEQSR